MCLAALVVACGSTNDSTTSDTISSKSKLTTGCIENYNSQTDYFPKKASVRYAQGFEVEYHKNYKVVTVKNPWQNATNKLQYILVQCGTPIPEKFSKTQVVKVPVNSIVALSSTHLPHLAKLGVVDKLIGVGDTQRVNTPEVVEKVKTGKIVGVGTNSSVNIERLLELNPELVTTFGTGNPQTDSHPKLLEAGLKVAINAEYMENTPLGRSEWLKFTALFFNQEEQAEKIFSNSAKKYEQIAMKAKAVKKRPTVFTGFNFKGTWYTPGCESYLAKYLADAGANLICLDKVTSSLPLSFEDVFNRAEAADYWLNMSQEWKTLKQAISEDNRYTAFTAVKKGNVYNNNLRVNTNGGNDYWESGISNPDIVLSDLIKILHPQILPNHSLVHYQKLS
jgi:iron complex transport system substrate-binding protein